MQLAFHAISHVVQYSSQIGLEEIVNKGFMVVFTSSRTDNDSQKSLPKSDNRNRQKSRDRFATSDPYCFLQKIAVFLGNGDEKQLESIGTK